MFLVGCCSCLCPIRWSQVFSREWRRSWSSADKRCSNYIWMINNFIAYQGANYIRGLTVIVPLWHQMASWNLLVNSTGNGLLPIQSQAVGWTNADLSSFGYLGTNISEIWLKVKRMWHTIFRHGDIATNSWNAHLSRNNPIKLEETQAANYWTRLFPYNALSLSCDRDVTGRLQRKRAWFNRCTWFSCLNYAHIWHKPNKKSAAWWT